MTRPRIASFSSPLADATGLVRFAWRGSSETMPLSMTVALDEDDVGRVRAEVWTNAGESASPDRYRALRMHVIDVRSSQAAHSSHGLLATFAVELPVRRVGNYRAVGRISVDDGPWIWMSESGLPDLRFRPRDVRHRGLLIEEVSVAHVNWDPFAKAPGTFADLVDGGAHPATAYTLVSLADRGVTAVCVMSPFDVAPANAQTDELGSPYAVRDFFSARASLSRAAAVAEREGADPEEVRALAIDEVRAFIEAAHDLGIRVLLDVALNHVGPEHRFRDLFEAAAGREVRADYGRVVADARRALVHRPLDEAATPPTLERSAPWMLASRFGDPHGARSASEAMAGGFGAWPDTLQLNHGRVRESPRVWRDLAPPLPEHRAVQGWLERILAFWALDVGVDGFRLDHLSGLPAAFLEGALSRVQAAIDAREREGTGAAHGKSLFVIGEDHQTSAETRHFVDAIQGGFFRDLLEVRGPRDLARVLDDPWLFDVLALSTHDEPRAVLALGDARAFARLQSLLLLAGGPASLVAGDHVAERAPLPFQRARGIDALRSPSREQRAAADLLTRAGRLRRDLVALRGEARAWLHPVDDAHGFDDALAAFTRSHAHASAVVVANFADDRDAARTFALDPSLGFDDGALIDVLTGAPARGCKIVDGALQLTLAPYEVRVLERR